MGVARRLVQRRHKLNDDVKDDVLSRERADKRDAILADSPGAFDQKRSHKRRLDSDFGKDMLDKKSELSWQSNSDIDRFDFGSSDFGLRVTLPASSQLSGRGFKAGDEFRILEEGSALEQACFKAVEEANSGDVAAGECRIVSATVLRLPDDAGWSDETDDQIRVEISAGARK
jgi:hypothetical protein